MTIFCTALIYYFTSSVRKPSTADPITYYPTNCNLSFISFTIGFIKKCLHYALCWGFLINFWFGSLIFRKCRITHCN